jgi:hypothetical protein
VARELTSSIDTRRGFDRVAAAAPARPNAFVCALSCVWLLAPPKIV